jgi:hypothetical protein
MLPHLRYLAYGLRHKWHVPLWQALIHDWTKFLLGTITRKIAYRCSLARISSDE